MIYATPVIYVIERERTKSSRIYDILFVYMVYIYIYSVIVFVILYNL